MRLLVFLCFLLGSITANAQNGRDSIKASVNPDVAEVNAPFRYSVEAQTFDSQPITFKSSPGFGDLEILGREETSQFPNINGVFQRILTRTWILRCGKTGTFSISPPKVQIGDAIRTPETVTIEIVEADKVPKSVKRKSTAVYIEASINPAQTAYIGQQINLEYTLYTDVNLFNPQIAGGADPPLDDFWVETLDDPSARIRTTSPINGRLMNAQVIRRFAIFPLHTGQIKISPYELTIASGGFMSNRRYEVESDVLEINVIPLPPNAPADFYPGNVGQWDIQARVESRSGRVGEAFNLTFQIAGNGDINRVRLPKLPDIKNTRVSGPQEKVEKSTRGSLVVGKKVGTWNIMPTKAGELIIPAISFSYFDPESGAYRTRKTAPIELAIANGALPPEQAEAKPLARHEKSSTAADLVLEQMKDLGKPTSEIWPNHRDAGSSMWFRVLLALLAAVVIGLLVEPVFHRWRRRREPLNRQKNRIQEALDAVNQAQRLEQLSGTLKSTLVECFALRNGRASASNIAEALERNGLSADEVARIQRLLDDLETARFAPDSAQPDIKTLKSRAIEAIEAIRGPALRAAARIAALLLCLGLALPSHAASPSEQFDAGEFSRAAKAWEQIAQSSNNAADYFNAGLAYAYAKDWGRARANLERARFLAPSHGRITKEIGIVKSIIRLNAIESTRVGRVIDGEDDLFWWMSATSFSPWALPVATLLMLVVSIVLLLLARKGRLATQVGQIATVISLFLGGAWAAQQHIIETQHAVVLLNNETTFHEGPTSLAAVRKVRGTTAGTLLRALELREDWVRVSLTNLEDTAWIPTSEVVVVH